MRMADYAAGLQHIGIPTTDMAETLLFYTELGFDIVHSSIQPDNGLAVHFLRLGGLTIEVYEAEAAALRTGSIDHIAIDVNDVEKAYEFICSRGMNNLEDEIHFLPYWENGIRYFNIEGPNKERIEFSQYL
ncbi:MAG: VOC family protein [Blautia sp.]|nr:VOC family protein [Blautia sp.]